MTVSSQISRIEQLGDGTTTAFAVSFYFLADADLKVFVDGVQQTIVTNYTVTGAGNPAGGSVNFVSAPANGVEVVIFRDPALTQGLDYIDNDPFPAESHERGLDKLTMIAQRIRDLVSRALRLGDSVVGVNTELPALTGGQLLGTNPGGTGFQLYPLGSTPQDAGSTVYTHSDTGAVATTVESKLRERVSVKDFGAVGDGITDDTAAIQNAINSGAKRLYISMDCLVSAPLQLAADQIIYFDGGSLITTAGISAPNGVMYGLNKANIKIVDPVIDASATTGVSGIWLSNCVNGKIVDGFLNKCALVIEGLNNTTPINTIVRGTVLDMNGWQSTSVFVSRAYKVSLEDIICYNGLEGVGLYNACRHIKHARCESYGHARDGFVVIDGQRISYADCMGYSNSQSGFTTQRLTSGTQAQYISYTGCHAYDNVFDGFDLRGAPDPGPIYGVEINITCSSCIAFNNGATGWYVVFAEGTTLSACVAQQNGFQGFAVNGSPRTLLTGCKSVSNANLATAGTSKAGIFFQDSPNCGAVGCSSENNAGVTQEYGISLTGSSEDCWITGGVYLKNSVTPAFLNTGDAGAFVAGAAIQNIGGVFTSTISGRTGVYVDSGFGVPTHTRPKASIFSRVDSGVNGEVYASNGAGSWSLL